MLLPGGPGTRSAKPPFSDKPPPVLPPLKKIFGSKPLKPSFKLVLLCLGNPGGMGSDPEKRQKMYSLRQRQLGEKEWCTTFSWIRILLIWLTRCRFLELQEWVNCCHRSSRRCPGRRLVDSCSCCCCICRGLRPSKMVTVSSKIQGRERSRCPS